MQFHWNVDDTGRNRENGEDEGVAGFLFIASTLDELLVVFDGWGGKGDLGRDWALSALHRVWPR